MRSRGLDAPGDLGREKGTRRAPTCLLNTCPLQPSAPKAPGGNPSSPTTSSKGPPTSAHFLMPFKSLVFGLCCLLSPTLQWSVGTAPAGECVVQPSAGWTQHLGTQVASGQQGEPVSHKPGPPLRSDPSQGRSRRLCLVPSKGRPGAGPRPEQGNEPGRTQSP